MYKDSKSTFRPNAMGSRACDQFRLSSQIARRHALKKMLIALRDEQIQTITHFVRTEIGTVANARLARMDRAYRQSPFEFRTRLISLSEGRLAAIRAAFDRLDEGRYGLC